MKISMEVRGLVPLASYPPASHTLPVAGSLSAAKLRLGFTNAGPRLQLSLPGSYTSTSLDGLGATRPPPSTHIWLFTTTPLVSPVALGMVAMVAVVSVEGS